MTVGGARFDLVTIDTPDPDSAGMFWCGVLAGEVVEREDDGRWVVVGSGVARWIGLQRGESRSGSVHLDLSCDVADIDSEVARLVGLGAVLRSALRREPYGLIANLAAPDGTLFDLCAYRS